MNKQPAAAPEEAAKDEDLKVTPLESSSTAAAETSEIPKAAQSSHTPPTANEGDKLMKETDAMEKSRETDPGKVARQSNKGHTAIINVSRKTKKGEGRPEDDEE